MSFRLTLAACLAMLSALPAQPVKAGPYAYISTDKSRYRKWMTLEPGYSVAPGYSGTLPSTTFCMEIGAVKVLTGPYPNPAFIKVARGGTALGVPGSDWYPAPLTSPDAGPLYKALIESTLLALQEITTAGETYTVHALFWHQGESDSSRTAQYGGLLTTLIESVRRDLAMPNLRFIVGGLAPALAGGLTGDDGNDGLTNAIEFAFGLDPLRSDPSSVLPQPVFGPAAATVALTPLPAQPGIFYQVDWSRNLASWSILNVVRSGNLLEFTIPTAGESSMFIRQRVEVTP